MNYRLFLVAACLFPIFIGTGSAGASTPAPVGGNSVEWQLEKSWITPAKPLDLVYSLDNKKIFILGADHQVRVYEAGGRLLGSIPVDSGVSAIDIEPRGTKLYLISEKDNSFSSLALDFVSTINIQGSPFMGRVDAPVVIAVFTDFE